MPAITIDDYFRPPTPPTRSEQLRRDHAEQFRALRTMTELSVTGSDMDGMIADTRNRISEIERQLLALGEDIPHPLSPRPGA